MNETSKRIVILGGGFGGVSAAMQLEKIFKKDHSVEIIFVSEQNYVLFTPMLPEVPASSIEAKHIIRSIRPFFRKVKFQNSSVQAIDLNNRMIKTSHCPVCEPMALSYDYLVLALGSVTNYFGLPGVADNALPMKTLSDAMALRNHVIDILEHADIVKSAAQPYCRSGSSRPLNPTQESRGQRRAVSARRRLYPPRYG